LNNVEVPLMSSSPQPSPPAPTRPPRVALAKGQEVSLGCGTLILIALIVLIFGRAGSGEIEQEVRQLRTSVDQLKKAVDEQTVEIKTLQEKLDKARAKE
jgi:hypothetical protein